VTKYEGKLLETQYFGELDEGIVEILRILAIIDEKFRIWSRASLAINFDGILLRNRC